MQPNDALRRMLEELGGVTHDEPVRVYLTHGDGSHADGDGNYVQVDTSLDEQVDVDVSGPNALRLVSDTHSHEMEHIRTSDLTSKRAFMDDYPTCPKVAGAVVNILEDQWVDAKRVERYPGHRRSRALKMSLIMDDDEFTPPVDEVAEENGPGAFVEGLKQLAFGGYVKGYEDAPENVRLFLADVEPAIDAVRNEPDPDERYEIAAGVMDSLFEYLDVDDAGPESIPEELARALARAAERAEEQTGGEEAPAPQRMPAPDDLADDDGDDADAEDGDAADASDEDGDEDDADGGGDDVADADGEGSGDGDGGDAADDDAEDGDGGAGGDGDGDPDSDADGDGDGDVDLSRVDSVLDEYDPDDLTVVN